MTPSAIRDPLSVLLAIGCVLALGCGNKPAAKRPSKVEVLLLGLDGASWNVLQPMLDRGALPNLKRMVDEGVSGTLRSELPCLSIVLWTSIATGKLPEEHGIRDWSYVDPETGEQGLMNSSRRRVPALWNIATAAGLRVGFVNWWATWPAEPVNGFIVSEQFTRTRVGETLERGTFPEALAEELRGGAEGLDWPWLAEQLTSGRLKVLSDRNDTGPPGSREERLRQALFLYGQDYRGELAVFQLLSERLHPQLLGYLSRKIDIASHYMWQFASSPRPDDEALSRLLEPVYRYEDRLVGRLLDAVSEDVNVVIVSDHGFTWESDGWGHEETAPPGIFLAMGPAFEQGEPIADVTLYDIAPSILHVLGMPAGKDMRGAPLVRALADERPVRWVETYDALVTGRPGTAASPIDERVLEELRALGYIQ